MTKYLFASLFFPLWVQVQEQCQYELVAPLAIMFASTLLQVQTVRTQRDVDHTFNLEWPHWTHSVCWLPQKVIYCCSSILTAMMVAWGVTRTLDTKKCLTQQKMLSRTKCTILTRIPLPFSNPAFVFKTCCHVFVSNDTRDNLQKHAIIKPQRKKHHHWPKDFCLFFQ